MFITRANAISPAIKDKKLQPVPHESTLHRIAQEPSYKDSIPRNVLRRMSKSTRMGIASAFSILENERNLDGIVIGTGLGGMQDSLEFLNQIVDFEEGTLTPTNFVKSTANALAGSLGMMLKNTNYNMTHVGKTGAFEAALLDTLLNIESDGQQTFLVGSSEEASEYNFNIDSLAGVYKRKPSKPSEVLQSQTIGAMSGEGAAMFQASSNKKDAVMKVNDIYHLTSKDIDVVNRWLGGIQSTIGEKENKNLILGYSGDVRMNKLYDHFTNYFSGNQIVFKHASGDYSTATSFAFYLAFLLAQGIDLPENYYLKKPLDFEKNRDTLIYNQNNNEEHNIIWCSSV